MPNGMARRVTFFIRPDGTVAGVNTKPSVATAAQDSLAQLAALSKQDEEARKPVGGGAPVRTGERPNQFVGPASARVTMDALVPDFALPDVGTGKNVALTTLSAGKKATVLLFLSAQCPVSKAYAGRIRDLAAAYTPRGVAFAAINSNGPEATAEVAEFAKGNGLTFPVLKDAGGVIAERFQAKRTPEVYVLDGKGVLVYHGAIDDAQNAAQVTKRHLATALDAVLAGGAVPVKETPAVGSDIKQ